MGRWRGVHKNLVQCRNAGVILLFLHTACLPAALAEEPTPEFLIRQVINSYRSLATYQVTGLTSSEITNFNEGGKITRVTSRFSILLKKPNLYRITWEEDFPPHWMGLQAAVWNPGLPQGYVYSQMAKGYMEIPAGRGKLLSYAAVSTGDTSIIPKLFFGFFPEKDLPFTRLKNSEVKGREEIDGIECYVLRGRDRNREVTYWISIPDYFIRKYESIFNDPNGHGLDLELTEEEAKASLRSRGVEPTQERIKSYQRTLKIADKVMRKHQVQIITTERYSNISLPTVRKEDLQYSMPDGTTLKENLFELGKSSLDGLENTFNAMEE